MLIMYFELYCFLAFLLLKYIETGQNTVDSVTHFRLYINVFSSAISSIPHLRYKEDNSSLNCSRL